MYRLPCVVCVPQSFDEVKIGDNPDLSAEGTSLSLQPSWLGSVAFHSTFVVKRGLGECGHFAPQLSVVWGSRFNLLCLCKRWL